MAAPSAMKTRTFPNLSRQLVAIHVATLLCVANFSIPSVPAATIIKANNTTNLNLSGSWVSGTAAQNDIAQWDNTITSANTSSLGADREWLGISILDPDGDITIGTGNTLTLGMGGINMGSAEVDLNILSSLTTRNFTHQIWNVATGRALTLDNGTFARSVGSNVNIQGSGTVNIGDDHSGIVNDTTGIVGPWLTTGAGTSTRYTTRDSTTNNLIAYTGTSIAVADIGSTPGLNAEVNASGTFGTGASVNTLRHSGGSATLAGNLTANGIMNAASGVLTLTGDITIGATRELIIDSAGSSTTISGIISDNAAGSSSLTKTSPSSLTLSGDNTYTGDTHVNRGVLIITHNNALGSTAGITYINGGDTASGGNPSVPGGQVRLSGGATGLTIAENFVVFGRGNGQNPQVFYSNDGNNVVTGTYTLSGGGGGSRIFVAADKLTMTGGINVTPDQSGLFILNPQTGATLAFTTNSVVLQSDGSFYLDSGGTVELGVAGNVWGNTRIISGTMKMMIANALPLNAIVNMGAGYGSNNDTLDLNGFSQETGSIVHGTTTMGGRTITNTSSTAATLAINQSTNGNFFGVLAGELSFVKKGGSNLVLHGAGTHTGDTRVEAGTLALNHVDALSASTLDTHLSGIQTVTFTVAGTNTYNIGGLKGSDDLAIGVLATTPTFISSNISVGANNQSTTYSGIISGTGGQLTKTGTGTLRLTNGSTYTGNTTVNDGSLLANNITGSATGTGSVTVQSGGSIGGNGFISTVATTGVTIQSGGILSPGDGPDRLTITAAINLNAGAFFNTQLAIGGIATEGNGTVGTSLLDANGTVSITDSLLTGTWDGDSDNLYTGGLLTDDHRLWLIDNDGSDAIVGLFANANTLADASIQTMFGGASTPYTTLIDGQQFAVFYNADFASTALTGGNDLLLVAIVPEPARGILFMAGAMIVLGARRRRR